MIKEHDKTKITEIGESGEDYLEAIFLLYNKNGYVRCVDIAEYFGYSKPSISRAVSVLEDGGYLIREKKGNLILTELGIRIAKLTYEKHCFFKTQLIEAGVEQEQADREACRMEHTVSEDSFRKIKSNAERRDVYGT